jgi:DNA-binding transcriptional MerR regulator
MPGTGEAAEDLVHEGLSAGVTDPEEVPNKLYFRIGEVARLAGIKPYVLRFWETEFAGIGPKKSGTGHRLYRRKDVQMVLEIKRLLYQERFTIEGARKFLEGRGKPEPAKASAKPAKSKTAQRQPEFQAALFGDPFPVLETVKKELADILAILKK